MVLSSQATQCPNYAAQSYPTAASTDGHGGVNNLSLLDQTIGTIPAGGSVSRMSHLAVGNLGTIQTVVNAIYSAGY